MTTTAGPGPSTRATYTSLIRARGVPGLFTIMLTLVVGTSLQIFALSVLAYQATGSALWSSAAFAAGFLPQLAGGMLFTSLADRWPARTLIASGSLARAASAFAIALGDLGPGAAIAAVAVVAIWQPVPMAAQSALLSRLVTGDRYVLARSVFSLISSGAQLLGLAVGGIAVQWLGVPTAFAVAGGLQVLGLLAALTLPATTTPETPGPWRPLETWQGNGGLLRDATVRHILLSWWLPPALLVGAEALVVPYATEQGGSAAPTGLLLAAFPAGVAVGDLVVGRLLSPAAQTRVMPWLFVLVGVPLLPFLLEPGLVTAGLCFAAASAGMAYQLGSQQAFVAAVSEDRRGLAFGLVGTGMMGGQGVGPLVAGGLAELVGAGATISMLGVAILLAAARFGRLPRRADLPGPIGSRP